MNLKIRYLGGNLTSLFEKFNPKNYKKTLFESFEDEDIKIIIEDLKKLSTTNKYILNNLDSLKTIIKEEDLKRLKLIKLLYCLHYNSEIFLNLGRILEKYLNNVTNYYKDNSITHSNISGFSNIIENFATKTLNEKSDIIVSGDLFEDKNTNNYISGKIKALTTLRNYGGHFKNIVFFENILNDQEKIDREIIDSISLIKDIINAYNIVKNNHSNN